MKKSHMQEETKRKNEVGLYQYLKMGGRESYSFRPSQLEKLNGTSASCVIQSMEGDQEKVSCIVEGVLCAIICY